MRIPSAGGAAARVTEVTGTGSGKSYDGAGLTARANHSNRRYHMRGLITIGAVLLVAWVFGFLVFKVAGFLIHLLLVVGAILLLIGLVKRVGRGISSAG